MRYTDKKSVMQVLSWLAERGVATSRESYQTFLRRVLNLLPDDKARELLVDLQLLRAVRRRLKLPLAPAPGRLLPIKAVKSFHARSRQLPLVGIVAPPTDAPRMRGTPEKPEGYGDWKIINEIARKKVFRKDRQMMLNMQGTVLQLKTREEYTPERLMEDFGLTATEAQSCFMTFTT